MSSAVLLMAYGTPRDLDDVESYYTHIRRGRPPTPEALEELTARYRAIGGKSPLLEITRKQAEELQAALGIPVFVGQKHAAPFIADAMAEIVSANVDHVVGLVLAPHYSTMSVGDYEKRARQAADELGWTGDFDMVASWHLEPGYVSLLAERTRRALESLPRGTGDAATVIFSAHSLPSRIVAGGDPYPRQLEETAAAVAAEAGLSSWTTAWQSAGATADDWLGPDLTEVLEKLAADDVPAVVVCPCGFVADHLEVLYDVDIEAAEKAERLGLALARTESPNADPAFIATLAAVARTALSAA